MPNGVAISAAVEGIVDEAVVRALILVSGASPGPVYGKQGKPFLQQRIGGYNAAARHAPWIVIVDLDGDYECAPPLLCFMVAAASAASVLSRRRARS